MKYGVKKSDIRFQQLFSKRLICLLKTIADFVCRELGVKYTSFRVMVPHDSDYKGCVAYCDYGGNIRIKLRHHRTKDFFSYDYLVDSVVHEIVHLIYNRHDKKFHQERRRVLRLVRNKFA